MSKRILICRSNPIAPDPRVEKMARSLAGGGYSVSLLGWDMSGKLPEQEGVAGVDCIRLHVKANFGRGLSNLGHELRWQVALIAWLVQHRKQYDAIHACDFDTVLPALLAKLLFGKKVVYDIFDFYADMLRRTPAAVSWLIRKIDLLAISMADAVILADDARRRQIQGSKPRCLEVIYNSPEDELAVLKADPSDASHEGLKIAYTGGMVADRGMLELVEVTGRHPQWRLDMAGYGVDEDRILAAAAGNQNITWHGRVSHERAMRIHFEADVLIATYDPEIPNNRYASPNKLFEAMMLGKPLIVARDTNMDCIVEHENCGLVVVYGNRPALEAALERLHLDPDIRETFGKNARMAYEKTYSWARMESRLLSLYRETVK